MPCLVLAAKCIPVTKAWNLSAICATLLIAMEDLLSGKHRCLPPRHRILRAADGRGRVERQGLPHDLVIKNHPHCSQVLLTVGTLCVVPSCSMYAAMRGGESCPSFSL